MAFVKRFQEILRNIKEGDKEMSKYALIIEDVTLYISWPGKLSRGEEIIVERREVKCWKKDIKVINRLFIKNGSSGKPRDRDPFNYQIKLEIGEESSGRCLENDNDNEVYTGVNTCLSKKEAK
ncbi:hypothetical protein MUP35_03505 [Patescibacteria group bacterium]|nr:hypothetical protein [Patescibacteria group bacterium]